MITKFFDLYDNENLLLLTTIKLLKIFLNARNYLSKLSKKVTIIVQ